MLCVSLLGCNRRSLPPLRGQDKESRAQVEGIMRAACSASELPPEGKVGTSLCLQFDLPLPPCQPAVSSSWPQPHSGCSCLCAGQVRPGRHRPLCRAGQPAA